MSVVKPAGRIGVTANEEKSEHRDEKAEAVGDNWENEVLFQTGYVRENDKQTAENEWKTAKWKKAAVFQEIKGKTVTILNDKETETWQKIHKERVYNNERAK